MRHNLVLGVVVVALVVILECDSILAVRKKIPSYSAEVTQLESPIAAYSPRFRSSVARSINFGNQRVYGAAATGARSLSARSLLPRSRLSKKRSSARSGQRKIKRDHQTPYVGTHKDDPQANLRVKRDQLVKLEPEHECSSSAQSKGKGKGAGKGGKSKNSGGISLLTGSHKFGIPSLSSGDLEISPSTQSTISSPVGASIAGTSGSSPKVKGNPIKTGITGTPGVTGSSTSLGLDGKDKLGGGLLKPSSGISLESPIGAQIETEESPVALQSSPEASVSIGGDKVGLENPLSVKLGNSGSDEGEQTSSTTSAGIGGGSSSSEESPTSSQSGISVSGTPSIGGGSSPASGSASVGGGNNDFSLSVSPTGADAEGPASLMTSVDDSANSGTIEAPNGSISTGSTGFGPTSGSSGIKAGGSGQQSDDQSEATIQQSSGESEKSGQTQESQSEVGDDNSAQAGGSQSGGSQSNGDDTFINIEGSKIGAKVEPTSENGAGALKTSLGDIGSAVGAVADKTSILEPSSGSSEGQSSGSQIEVGLPSVSGQEGNIGAELGPSGTNVDVGLGSLAGTSVGVGNQTPSGQETGSSSTLEASSPGSTSTEWNSVDSSGDNESRSGAALGFAKPSGSSSSSSSSSVPKLSIKQGNKLAAGNKKVKMGIKMPALYESPRVSELPAKCRARLYDMKRALAELVALTENFGQKVLLDRSLSYLTREILSRRLREVRSLAKEARLAGSLGNLIEFKETAREAGLEALRIGNLQSTKKLEPSWIMFAQSLRRLFSVFKKACKV